MFCKRSYAMAGREWLSSPGEMRTDVLPLLDIRPRPEVWGVHGVQRLKTDGSMEMPHLDEQALDGLSDADRWLGYHATAPPRGIQGRKRRRPLARIERSRRGGALGPASRSAGGALRNTADLTCWNSTVVWRFARPRPTKGMRFVFFSMKSARMRQRPTWATTPPMNLLSAPAGPRH